MNSLLFGESRTTQILAWVSHSSLADHLQYKGSMSFKARDQAIDNFAENPEIRVLLSSLRCGGCKCQTKYFTVCINAIVSGVELDHGVASDHPRSVVEQRSGAAGVLPYLSHRPDADNLHDPYVCAEYDRRSHHGHAEEEAGRD